MARFDLTDFEWSVISPLLPNWADTPERYGRTRPA
jgi:hypothetical protein